MEQTATQHQQVEQIVYLMLQAPLVVVALESVIMLMEALVAQVVVALVVLVVLVAVVLQQAVKAMQVLLVLHQVKVI